MAEVDKTENGSRVLTFNKSDSGADGVVLMEDNTYRVKWSKSGEAIDPKFNGFDLPNISEININK